MFWLDRVGGAAAANIEHFSAISFLNPNDNSCMPA